MPTVKRSSLSRPDLAGRWPLTQAQGSPGSRCSTSPALLLLLRRARQHRKVAVRSPRPTPRAARDMLWARSRQGPHREKVMPVPDAPASTARAPKGRTQRDQEPPAPPVAKNRACWAPGGSGDARPGRVGSGKDSGDLMFPTRWPCFGWGWGGDGRDAHHTLRSHPGLSSKSQLVPDLVTTPGRLGVPLPPPGFGKELGEQGVG